MYIDESLILDTMILGFLIWGMFFKDRPRKNNNKNSEK